MTFVLDSDAALTPDLVRRYAALLTHGAPRANFTPCARIAPRVRDCGLPFAVYQQKRTTPHT
jgi:hypothetical protein